MPILHTTIAQPTVLPEDRDEVFHNIRDATSINSLLDIVVIEKKRLKIPHIVKIFRCLSGFQKKPRWEMVLALKTVLPIL